MILTGSLLFKIHHKQQKDLLLISNSSYLFDNIYDDNIKFKRHTNNETEFYLKFFNISPIFEA
jgi:hypothetical protein